MPIIIYFYGDVARRASRQADSMLYKCFACGLMID